MRSPNDTLPDSALMALVLAGTFLYLAADLASAAQGLDGTVYAAIARLLADGLGSFWFPPHFDAAAGAFHDHPPLGLWLESQWFRLAGDAFWSDKLLSALAILCIVALVGLLWRTLGERQGLWWVVLLLVLMPVSTRALKTNTLETMVVITALLGVWGAWRGRTQPSMNLVTGAACLAGVLIKGPAALFPLAAPWLFGMIVDRNPRQAHLHALIAGLGWLLPLLLLVLLTPGGEALMRYLEQQLFASLSSARTIEHGRLYQLGQLGIQLGIALLAVSMAWLSSRRLRWRREAWAMLAVGLCASLPLLVSPRQYKHYLLPALPFFAIALALTVKPRLPPIRSVWIWACAAILTTTAAVRAAAEFGKPGNDQQILDAVAVIAAETRAAALPYARFSSAMPQHQAYLARYYGIRSVVTPDSAAAQP